MDNERLWRDWLKLFFYFQHESTEGEITERTYDSMMDALMSFKPTQEK